MCLSKLFKQPKIETPALPEIPAPPPTPSPPPQPTAVESQTQAQDIATKRRRQLSGGLASTIKSRGGGIFNSSAELSSVGGGSRTLG